MSLSNNSSSDSGSNTFLLLFGIWEQLHLRRRLQLCCLVLLMLLNGFAELVSLGAALPFLTAIASPSGLKRIPFIDKFVEKTYLYSDNQILLLSTVSFIVLILSASATRLLTLWSSGKLAASIGSELSCEAYRRSLYQPYQWHLSQNSSELIATSTLYISRSVVAMSSFLQLITSSFAACFILCGLILVSWKVALGALLLFSSLYLLISLKFSNKFKANGNHIAELSRKQIQLLQEGYGGIRDILIDNNQLYYSSIYKKVDYPQRNLIATNQFLTLSPRYLIEAIGLVAFALASWLFVSNDNSNTSIIPILGTLALGAQKLLPTFQSIYANFSKLKTFNADLSAVLGMLRKSLPPTTFKVEEKIKLVESIGLKNISFSYQDDRLPILRDINLCIKKGECIGIIGETGSGKSTLADIIMGLLQPNCGELLIDKFSIYQHKNLNSVGSWRSLVAHVPQVVYLSDGTIAENIALGIPFDLINMQRISYAANLAQLDQFIGSLENGYSTRVGERGVQLSGGQRQRIGIARALYKNAQVLILDEATSALDESTEDNVMSSIKKLGRNYTIIIIAHRLSTLMFCDKIIKLESGTISSFGSPDVMLKS